MRTYLAQLVSLITPGDLQYSFLTNSGTESVEACLKMAILTTGRQHFMGTLGAFHGKTLGLPRRNLEGHVPRAVPAAEALDPRAVGRRRRAADDDGERRLHRATAWPRSSSSRSRAKAGSTSRPPGYLAAAREICDKYGAMLVFDEVQCGMGRSGKMFCCEHDGVVPDLMALGKGFGGGVMPIGAVVGTPRTWEKYIENPFLHTTTFGGNPVCCAAAIATIHVLLEEDLPRQAAEKGEFLLAALRRARGRVPEGAGGRAGPRADARHGVHEPRWATRWPRSCSAQILISGTYINAQVLRVEPPLMITYPELEKFLAALEGALQDVSIAL